MISFKKHSGIFTLEATQYLPIGQDEAWSFFSSPSNLTKITPSYMGFKITSGDAEEMYPGQIITYSLGLFPGVKSSWVTEITQVDAPHFFIDEQRFGPYSMWHHEHSITPTPNGVRVHDKISYKLPMGKVGVWVEKALVRQQLKDIFEHRKKTLNKLFNV